MDAGSIIILVVGIAVIGGSIIGIVAGSFGMATPGWEGIAREAALWATFGLVAGLINGPQIKSGEHPTLLVTLGQGLALGLALALAGAILGRLFSILYSATLAPSVQIGFVGPVLRIVAGLVAGGLMGALAGMMGGQLLIVGAALIGLTNQPSLNDNLLYYLAESAQGFMYEGGILTVGLGGIVGAIMGIVMGFIVKT